MINKLALVNINICINLKFTTIQENINIYIYKCLWKTLEVRTPYAYVFFANYYNQTAYNQTFHLG